MTWLILTGLAAVAAIALHDWRTKGTRAQQAVRETTGRVWTELTDEQMDEWFGRVWRELGDERDREFWGNGE